MEQNNQQSFDDLIANAKIAIAAAKDAWEKAAVEIVEQMARNEADELSEATGPTNHDAAIHPAFAPPKPQAKRI